MTQEKTDRQILSAHLRGHDWWYMMSDDHRYYRAGEMSLSGLRDKIRRLDCPWTLGELRAWALGMTSDLYGPEVDGFCPRLDRRGSARASQLIPRILADEINHWMEG